MGEVLYLGRYRREKQAKQDLAKDRTPLYVSHTDHKIYGNGDKNFGDRAQRVRESLEKINLLMAEYKKLDDKYVPSDNIIKGETDVIRDSNKTGFTKKQKEQIIRNYGKL